VRLVRATQTSAACPSQWDAYDESGNYWYLRYRHGVGEARRYDDPDWISSRARPLEVLTFEHGHPLDGVITLEEFALRAGFGLAAQLREVSFGEYLADGLHAAVREREERERRENDG
jgi:hypothetical protein